MSKEPVVMIFRERNDANVCCIPFSGYPTSKVPEIGDKFPLHAQKTFRASSNGGPVKDIPIEYYNGVVTVTEVWAGEGDLLHPNNGCPMYSFPDDVQGYGIRVAWDSEDIPKGAKPIEAEVIFGL